MRKLIIVLLCLAGLAVVIDFGVAAYSEYRVSRALRVGADLSADPEVTIHGFPFLTQALDGRYQNVDVRAHIMRPDIPGEVSVEATLTGAHLSLSDLSDGNVRTVPVDRAEGRMRLEPTELGKLFKIPDLQVHSAPGNKSDGTGGSGGSGMTTGGQLLLTGTMPGKTPSKPGAPLGGDNVSVTADLTIDGDQVKIVATSIYRGTGTDTTTAVVSEAERPMVLEQFTRTIDTKELPFGLRPTKVYAMGGQIVVEGKSENVTIDLDRLQRP
ncbi:LmeA family phospholipid-binding protein [Nocardia sp. NBC_00565]|uniref:LmeA family phospholipid-binding protein n=1 Tax=Nocardia sp. NBC_00565 TaxID=2975993 RepID=UPI002E822C7B|nr:LmeA family phospholipid-binding protein [Nocardia sp. NBC_00565]WUC02604.1 LmeA family phospholipid-binding protein [Nocardia sp. NBC_00565]